MPFPELPLIAEAVGAIRRVVVGDLLRRPTRDGGPRRGHRGTTSGPAPGRRGACLLLSFGQEESFLRSWGCGWLDAEPPGSVLQARLPSCSKNRRGPPGSAFGRPGQGWSRAVEAGTDRAARNRLWSLARTARRLSPPILRTGGEFLLFGRRDRFTFERGR